MSAVCEICNREFKTTQGLRGHKTFVHGMTKTSRSTTRLGSKEGQSDSDGRLSTLGRIASPKEIREPENLLNITEKPLTEQVSEVTKQVSQLTEQLNELVSQLEVDRITKATWEAHEEEHERHMEQLCNEWQDAHNELVSTVYRIDELVKKGFSATEDGTERIRRQVSDLKSVVEQLQERVKSKLTLQDQLSVRIEAMEGKLSQFENEIGILRNLTHRLPTGKLISVRLNDGRNHDFKEYKSGEGLARPYRHSRDLIFGDRWIDLAEPED